MTTDHHALICARWKSLAQVAAGIVPTRLPLEPLPPEIRALRDDLEALIAAVDPLVSEYAAYLEQMTGHKINRDAVPVDDALLGALDGQLLYEITEAADKLHEDLVMGVT